jgi:hypothetical protein
MDERHTEHVDIEVDRCLHVVGAEREVMDAAQSRCHERTAQVFTHVDPPVSPAQCRFPSRALAMSLVGPGGNPAVMC